MKKVTYTPAVLESLLTRVPQWTERLANATAKVKLPEVSRVYLVGTGAGFAAALAVKKAFWRLSGITGEDVLAVTPAHLRLSVLEREKCGALAVVFGAADTFGCKAEVRISEAGELPIEDGGLLETYLQTSIAGLLLAESLCQRSGMAEKIFRASRAALAALPAWDADTQAAAGTISGLVDAYETVGTGSDYGAAWLARMLLYAGAPAAVTTVEESEDWLHVNFLQLTPERFATLLFVSSENEAADRTQRTLGYIEGVGRRTVIFTDLPRDAVEPHVPVVAMPSMEQALLPVFLPLPAALLAGRLG